MFLDTIRVQFHRTTLEYIFLDPCISCIRVSTRLVGSLKLAETRVSNQSYRELFKKIIQCVVKKIFF